MRHFFLSLVTGLLAMGAAALPRAASGQPLSDQPADPPVLVISTDPAGVPAPAPPSVDAPPSVEAHTTDASVTAPDAEPKSAGLVPKAGAVAGGVAGSVAGAAIAGPVGKVAGGFIGKRIARALFGSEKKADAGTGEKR